MFWSNSTVFHAVSDRLEGPFKIQNSVGKGHNPEAFQLKDGRVVVYVIDGYYIAEGWTARCGRMVNSVLILVTEKS